MAAIRSALVMLGRRCGSSGSCAAASMGRRGLGIHQVFRPAAPWTPPQPSLPRAGRKLESWRRFSTAGREQTGESEGVVPMWWQRWRNRVNNLDVYAYATVVMGGSALYLLKTIYDLQSSGHS